MKLTVIAFRNIKRNKRRSMLSGVAIAISVMAIIGMFAFINGIMGDYKYNVLDFMTGHIRIRNVLYDKEEYNSPLQLNVGNTNALLTKLDNMEGIKAAVPRIQFGTAIYGSPLLARQDIADFPGLVSYLEKAGDPVSRELMKHAGESLKAGLAQFAGKQAVDEYFQVELLDYLNLPLQRRLDLERMGVDKNKLSAKTKEWEKQLTGRQEDTWYNRIAVQAYLPYYNRQVLEDILPQYIKPTRRTGNTFAGVGLGVDFAMEKNFIHFEKFPLAGRLPATGRQAKEMLLASGLARELQLGVGDKITIYTKTSERMSMNQEEFRITGVVSLNVGMFNKKFFFIPIDTAQTFLRMEDASTDILIYAKEESRSKKLADSLNRLVAGEHKAALASADADAKAAVEQAQITAQPWTSIGMYSTMINYASMAYLFMGLFFFVLGSTVIVVTTMMVIFERMREIGTMAAMGMKGNEIVRLFFLEAFFISAAAAGVGVLAGLAITIPLSIFGIDFGTMMQGLDFEISLKIYPRVDLPVILFIYLYAVAVASLVSVIPSRRAAGIEPVEALRTI